ncbi:hypothetical protein GCM10022416_28130 [Actinomadura keratinilytica]|jgi:DHA2 family multidrug resistance protein-like MFS transporter|uniref:Uncharacterized protein n=1 Tax=Actinomadura keratinilytica TaxID=547461 RepID=A0ABP7YSR3_9ACTN
MGAHPVEKSGSAAAVNETAAEFGIAMGVAVIGMAGTAAYRNQSTAASRPGSPPASPRPRRTTRGGVPLPGGPARGGHAPSAPQRDEASARKAVEGGIDRRTPPGYEAENRKPLSISHAQEVP